MNFKRICIPFFVNAAWRVLERDYHINWHQRRQFVEAVVRRSECCGHLLTTFRAIVRSEGVAANNEAMYGAAIERIY